MKKRNKYLILGFLLILVGIISLPFCFIYVTLIDNRLAPLLILCIVVIVWGIQLIIKAVKLKYTDAEK